MGLVVLPADARPWRSAHHRAEHRAFTGITRRWRPFASDMPEHYETLFQAWTPMTAKDFVWLHVRDLPYFRAMLRAVEAAFYQDYPLPSPVLDLGCGDGHFASLAFDQPLDVGLDPWTGPIRQARRTGAYRSLVQADAGRMPFSDGSFAGGLSNSVLEHIPHIDAVLAETSRVLKPGALFLFCVPNPRYLSELLSPYPETAGVERHGTRPRNGSSGCRVARR
jgi:SAM-dependent methyltransferase